MKAATINGGGEINIFPVKLEEPLSKIVLSTGSNVTAIIVSGIDLSDEVKAATNQAAAEKKERESEQATAHSIKNVRDILGNDLDPNLAAVISANIAGVQNVRGNAVSSGSKRDDLGNKIITAAALIGDKNIPD